MEILVHEKNNNRIAEIQTEKVIIKKTEDFLDLLSDVPSKKFILKKENIDGSFFDLKTGLAGEILQKASTYRIYLGIAGDFENIESSSLRSFIAESNRTGQIVFMQTVHEILEIFGGQDKRV
ncbi:DUF4180 domain-containing protein [Brucepastera parasyntrophica]|uniref:DUF4180 domain-containing protein n=1 Tax=Brucepastera parasyntrophica TaxID=2880008 RepID=UPI00210D683F|nr:DUF4180 domain-containing protein [Brucepastera parasyntrophica]ULQ58992.1 DUF4180 domain-containing protein [Brucepastera parasyntrophica]